MQVETYEVEEIKSSEAATMACDAESMELVSKLGLAGQMRLQNTETGTRVPYRKLTNLETLVYSTLFTAVTPLENYDSGIIPLRVLQIAAYCKEAKLFTELRVWHPADVRKDPLLIGWKQSPQHPWVGDSFLLARWGEALESFEQLSAKAAKLWCSKHKAKLLEIRGKVESDLRNIEHIADAAFLGGEMPSLHYSAH